MGASTVKKNRQTAREAGTDRKTNAQLKEEKKQKKEKIKWTCVVAVIVLFFAFVVYLNTGAFYRNINGMTVNYAASEELGIEAGKRSFSVAECNYVYGTQYVNLVNSYGDYISMLGLDTSKPLNQQECTMVEKEDENASYTWHDYFMDSTKTYLTQLAILDAYADKLGLSLTEDDIKIIDENIASFDAAKEYGYGSVGKFISAYYGKGVNVSVVRSMLELQQTANAAQLYVHDGFKLTADDLTKKYAEIKDSYDKLTYDFYLVEAVADTPAEDAEEDAEPTYSEEALKAALTTAEEIQAKLVPADGAEAMSLEDAVKSVDAKATVSEKKDIAGMELEEALSKWLLDAERAEGDSAALEADNGAYVVVFKSRDDNKHKTDESGDMNYCDYIADELLRTEKLNEWTEKTLMPVQDASSVDSGFSARYIKR